MLEAAGVGQRGEAMKMDEAQWPVIAPDGPPLLAFIEYHYNWDEATAEDTYRRSWPD